MKNYVSSSGFISIPVKTKVASGEIYAVGDLVGIAANDAEPGSILSISTKGIFSLKKNKSETFNLGDTVYVKLGSVTKDKKEAPYLGVVVEEASQDMESCKVYLK